MSIQTAEAGGGKGIVLCSVFVPTPGSNIPPMLDKNRMSGSNFLLIPQADLVFDRHSPTTDGPVESTWGAFVPSAEERRFGAAEPGSLTQGQRANARTKTRWQGVSLEK